MKVEVNVRQHKRYHVSIHTQWSRPPFLPSLASALRYSVNLEKPR